MKSLIEWRANENLRKFCESDDPYKMLDSAYSSLAASDPKAYQSIQMALADDEIGSELISQYEQFAQQMQNNLTAQVVVAWLKQQANQPYVNAARYKAASAGQKFNTQQEAPAQVNAPRPSGEVDANSLGLHPGHSDVYHGSTADAPSSYKYVYIANRNNAKGSRGKYMHNPNYQS
jgi:hypothetical protein